MEQETVVDPMQANVTSVIGSEAELKQVAPREVHKEVLFRSITCSVCGERAIIIVGYQRPICIKCLKVDGPCESENYEDYVTVKDYDIKQEDSRFAFRYKKPTSNPEYGWPGRNETCTCGSGKKFKKCCLNGRMEEIQNNVANKLLEDRFVAMMHDANQTKMLRTVKKYMNEHNVDEVKDVEVGFKPLSFHEQAPVMKKTGPVEIKMGEGL